MILIIKKQVPSHTISSEEITCPLMLKYAVRLYGDEENLII